MASTKVDNKLKVSSGWKPITKPIAIKLADRLYRGNVNKQNEQKQEKIYSDLLKIPELSKYKILEMEKSLRNAVTTAKDVTKTLTDYNKHLYNFVNEMSKRYTNIVSYGNSLSQIVFYDVFDKQRIVKDLLELGKEFAAVHYIEKSDRIVVTTKPITLRGVVIGQYYLHLYVGSVEKHINSYDNYALHPIEIRPTSNTLNGSGMIHSHVTATGYSDAGRYSFCEGNGQTHLKKCLNTGNYFDLFIVLNTILSTPSGDDIKYFAELQLPDFCLDCMAKIEIVVSCNACHKILCNKHAKGCSEPKCKEFLCINCGPRCAYCNLYFCKEHSTQSMIMIGERRYCKTHIIECPDCKQNSFKDNLSVCVKCKVVSMCSSCAYNRMPYSTCYKCLPRKT